MNKEIKILVEMINSCKSTIWQAFLKVESETDTDGLAMAANMCICSKTACASVYDFILASGCGGRVSEKENEMMRELLATFDEMQKWLQDALKSAWEKKKQ